MLLFDQLVSLNFVEGRFHTVLDCFVVLGRARGVYLHRGPKRFCWFILFRVLF